eukprot:scaffold63315_cov34-Prasinocladus_malaysianus.AAC.1
MSRCSDSDCYYVIVMTMITAWTPLALANAPAEGVAGGERQRAQAQLHTVSNHSTPRSGIMRVDSEAQTQITTKEVFMSMFARGNLCLCNKDTGAKARRSAASAQ